MSIDPEDVPKFQRQYVVPTNDVNDASRGAMLALMYAADEALPTLAEVRLGKTLFELLGPAARAEWTEATKRAIAEHDIPESELHFFDAAGDRLARAGFTVTALPHATNVSKGGNA